MRTAFRKSPFASEEDVAKVLIYQHKLLNAYVAAEPGRLSASRTYIYSNLR